MIFRRPELEKDNPIAPEPYVGPRRRLAMARAAALKNEADAGKMKEALQALVRAAARFLREQPNVSKPGKNLVALRDAIAKADEVLAADTRSKGLRKARR
ncbi:MAG: hypothetical protein CV089_21670 [Nitrospira sp. WS110]|nr:hypothetical protein [Nitrospira sp. WS110]